MIQEIEYKIVVKAEGKARLPKISNRRKPLASLGLKVKKERVLCQNPPLLGAEQEPGCRFLPLLLSVLAMPHCGILVPASGIKPTPPAWEAQNLNHWTTREVPLLLLLKSLLLSPLTKGRSGAWKKNGFSSLPVF